MSNKSGIADNIINLPQGGGAQKGMGETFSPDLFSGTGNFSIPIGVPAGRNGLQPSLTVGYSTGGGNSEYGLGWGLSVPGIMRKTNRGIPIYDDKKDTFILSGAEDLIPIHYSKEQIDGIWHFKTKYQPRTEGLFARITHHKTNTGINYWEVRSKDGLTSYYGNPEATDPDSTANTVIAHPSRRDHIFGWKLYRTLDVFGNDILYTYERDLSETTYHLFDQLYLSRIDYTNFKDGSTTRYLCSVQFTYENRPDPFSNHLAGFELRTEKRIKHVATYTHPHKDDKPSGYSDPATGDYMDILGKRYDFLFIDQRVANKELDAKMLPKNGMSILSQVQVNGYDHNATPEKMPPLEFRYSGFHPIGKDFKPINGENLPPMSLGHPEYEVADLNGNGLPDIVQINATTARYWSNKGDGTFDIPRQMKKAPANVSLAEPEVSFADANGDGRVDLLVNKPSVAGYFSLNPDGEWDHRAYKKYKYKPSFSFQDPEVQLMDLTGDGSTDVLRNGSRFELYYHDRDEGWYDSKFVHKERLEGFPNISFSDPRIRVSGMSGGGMQDIVLLQNGNISYWPNQGYGNFGKRVVMKNAPKFPLHYNPARIMIADFDGDGLPDIVYLEDNKVTLWVNQSGNAWGDPIEIIGTPRLSDMDAVRAIDMMGTGVPGILWSYNLDAGTREQMYYLDLTGGIKPYLLNEMVNNMGALTRVQYRSSIKDYLRDQGNRLQKATNPDDPTLASAWKTTLPMPVLIVGKVEVHDLISKGKMVTEYFYHHGYWDGIEREFRGFGRVDQKDTETFERYHKETLFDGDGQGWYSDALSGNPEKDFMPVERLHFTPPMFTRSWFHLGPVQETSILNSDLNTDWTEVDYVEEYHAEKWNGVNTQSSTISRPKAMINLLKSLPRRARRDAYRSLRGAVLRTELFAIDSTRFQYRPYTITEANYGLRKEYDTAEFALLSGGRQDESEWQAALASRKDSGHIFFSFSVGQRTTQWERGRDPMTSFAFTDDYDAYGQPLKQVAIAVPRYRDFLQKDPAPAKGYSATLSTSELIHKDSSTHYLIGRVEQAKSYEAVNNGEDTVFELRDKILAEDASITFDLLGHSLTYYDGDTSQGFIGLPLGQLGDYGVAVRSETLVSTDALWTDAYGSVPAVLQSKASLPGSYPTEFKDKLPDKAGYRYKNSAPYETGYYVEGGKTKLDFHDAGLTTYGRAIAMRDPLDKEATVTFDAYDLLPKTVTDPLGMQTEAWYDYRLLTPYKAKDPNDNFSEFAFNKLGLLYKSAQKAKYDVADGSDDTVDRIADDLAHPSSVLAYDFFNFMNTGDPVWVKTTQRQYHYYGPTPEFGDKEDRIIGCEYSDGFGRLLQSRSQAEEVIYGDPSFGSSGLPADQSENGPCVGYENTDSENPNVVVNGWTIYNNKGKPVEQYEPFFAQGFDYVDGQYASITSVYLWHLVKEYVDANGENALSNSSALAAYINAKTNRTVSSTALVALLKQLHIIRDELSLDDDYIDFGNRSEYDIGTSDFSVAMWFKMDAGVDQHDTFISNRKYDGLSTYDGGFTIKLFTSNNQIRFIASDGTGAGTSGTANLRIDLPSKEEWHHMVWVRKGNDADDWTCYLNGVAQTVTVVHNNLSDGDISDNSNMKIGSMTDGHPSLPGYFNGLIKEVKLYTRELIQADVNSLYSDPCGAAELYTSDLIFYAPLNDNKGANLKEKALGQSGALQQSSYSWARAFISTREHICPDDLHAREVMGKGFIGQKSRIFYDPRGQVVRSISPDNTESRVVMGVPHDLKKPPVLGGPTLDPSKDGTRDSYTPSPWLSYAFDANDLGAQYSLPSGETLANLGLIAPDDGSQGYESHFATPKSSEINELGQTIKTTEHLGTGNANDDIVMQYEYDIRGNVVRIIDALDREVFSHKYDLANQTLWTDHIDSGVKTVVYDLMGRPTEMKDAKGSHIINSYDDLNRPIRMWAADHGAQSLALRSIAIFGDDPSHGPSSPKATNHLGMPYKSYDEAGLVEISTYDFKGGVLEKKQMVIKDSLLTSTTAFTISLPTLGDANFQTDIDNILEYKAYTGDVATDGYVTNMEYDGIGRPTKITYPKDVNNTRKELKPKYNKGGGIHSVSFDGTEYVKEIAYNAKGQRLLLALGNGTMTRYGYGETNFRLLRMCTEEFSYTNTGLKHQFAFEADTQKQDLAYLYDLKGNIKSINTNLNDSGYTENYGGSAVSSDDELSRRFQYDPINRLIEAIGREAKTNGAGNVWNQNTKTNSPVNASGMRQYKRTYQYDKMGNVQELQHQSGSNSFTRNFNYRTGLNQLNTIDNGATPTPTVYTTYTHDASGNQTQLNAERFLEWDYADQLKLFKIDNGTATKWAQYRYSGGQRVKKVSSVAGGNYTTTVYIDGIFEYQYLKRGGNSYERNYSHIMDDSTRIAQLRTGSSQEDIADSMLYVVDDHLGTSTLRLTGAATLIDRQEYYPFGETSLRSFDYKRYQYTGKERDEESGLYYYGARYYSAWTCRFIGVDPLVGKTFYQSSYTYADNNPIMMNDPTGMVSEGGEKNDPKAPRAESPQYEMPSDPNKPTIISDSDIHADAEISITQNNSKLKYESFSHTRKPSEAVSPDASSSSSVETKAKTISVPEISKFGSYLFIENQEKAINAYYEYRKHNDLPANTRVTGEGLRALTKEAQGYKSISEEFAAIPKSFLYKTESWPVPTEYEGISRTVISGMYRNSSGNFHGAVDIAYIGKNGQLSGIPIRSTHSGTVFVSGYSKTAGNWIVVQNGNVKTTYMHMSTLPELKKGERIKSGKLLGYIGNTGHSLGPHLHYQLEVRINGEWKKENPVIGEPKKVNINSTKVNLVNVNTLLLKHNK